MNREEYFSTSKSILKLLQNDKREKNIQKMKATCTYKLLFSCVVLTAIVITKDIVCLFDLHSI